MLDVNRLRGVVYSQFRSMAECATKAGWTRQKLSHVMSGKQVLDINEAKHLGDVLGLDRETSVDIFLS